MSNKRLRTTYRKSASKLHRLVGAVLKTHPLLSKLRSYQEYPIPHTAYHVDWMLLDFKLAIEIMGEQHERPVAFDGNKEQAEIRFEQQVQRDHKKKDLVLKEGWKWLEIWYDEPVTEDYIAAKIVNALS